MKVICGKHGEVDAYTSGKRLRCKQCNIEGVTRRRKRVKEILVAEHGGCCQLCGYAKYVGGLDFHHLDPTQKSFGISASGNTYSLAKMRLEAAKCVLLCRNCHSEVEGGVTFLGEP